jgi:hypothetical protein
MIAALAAMLLIPVTASAQDQCAELVQACRMKRQLGEQGEGNCKKARACVAQVCGELRQACMNKQEAGEVGQGVSSLSRDLPAWSL